MKFSLLKYFCCLTATKIKNSNFFHSQIIWSRDLSHTATCVSHVGALLDPRGLLFAAIPARGNRWID